MQFRKYILPTVGVGIAGYGLYATSVSNARMERLRLRSVTPLETPPSRNTQLKRLQSNVTFDVLVIGGGATGAGIALDAATRGLTCALVERDDFSAGTSSRSTKLIHGGVRYLEKGVFGLMKFQSGSWDQIRLVFEALHERKHWFRVAPHLAKPLPLITPCYKAYELPYYYAGLKLYDLIAGRDILYYSYFLSRDESLKNFPMLSARRAGDGQSLKGSVVYYDGQMNDSRMNVSLALTAAGYGAAVANHVSVVSLLKDDANDPKRVTGARVKDELTGNEWDVRARVVINAAGPFVDSIRDMDKKDAEHMITPSAGVHIILPPYYSPEQMGLLIPKTEDGRVVFMLPWMGHTIAGTTDSPCPVTARPQPHEEDVQFILDSIGRYLKVDVRREDVKSAWSGIRPLAKIPTGDNDESTENIVRDHIIYTEEGTGLITITGGKWTTYRLMAQECVDKAVQIAGVESGPCVTTNVKLIGAHKWDPAHFTVLAQHYKRRILEQKQTLVGDMDVEIAEYLSNSYGDKAEKIAEIAQDEKNTYGSRLVHGHPVMEAEVVYAVRNEYACTAIDFIAYRARIAFLDAAAAERALPRVVEIMANELKWDRKRCNKELEDAKAFLATLTGKKKDESRKWFARELVRYGRQLEVRDDKTERW